ncbi:MAG: hypothetical protein JJU36_06995 [Phycisphaeraceae bacterium]|nr:hypothetical protein [Phycisphaeraceae bacterium]
MSIKHDNVRAGIFVLLGLVIFVSIIMILADFRRFTTPMERIEVFFLLSDGVDGLKPGSPVTLGHQPIGVVAAIEDVHTRNERPRVIGKKVVARIPQRYKLGWDARIVVDSPLIGSGGKLNIETTGRAASPILPEDQREERLRQILRERDYEVDVQELIDAFPAAAIPGHVPGNRMVRDFIRQIGIGDRQVEQVPKIVGSLAKILEDVGEIIEPVKAKKDVWVESIDSTIADVGRVSGQAREWVDALEGRRAAWIESVDTFAANANKLAADLVKLVEDHREDVSAIVESAKKLATAIEASFKQDGAPAVAKFHKAVDDIAALVAGQKPVLEQAMASMAITAGQLKLAAIEVRRSPWRLLYEPGSRELETDNLYDAVRSFTLAAEALRATSASLNAMAAREHISREEIEAKQEYLDELFKRFQKAEKRFWEELDRVDPRK